MPEILGDDRRGALIKSYHLVWDSGTGSTFTTLIGDPTNSIERTFKKTGLTSGIIY
jgi:hypothetical protein